MDEPLCPRFMSCEPGVATVQAVAKGASTLLAPGERYPGSTKADLTDSRTESVLVGPIVAGLACKNFSLKSVWRVLACGEEDK